jgi:NADH-quinone oxidoreductase subunit J
MLFDSLLLAAEGTESGGLPVLFGLPILLGAAAYILAVAFPKARLVGPAAVCLIAAIACGWSFWWGQVENPIEAGLFGAFSALAIATACGMQVETNPVYVALWFASVVLSVCGLFLMQGAAFISAATIIVYAGAIIVTFLFLIMLAKQTGASLFDRRFRHPVLGVLLGSILLGVLIYVMRQPMPEVSTTATPFTFSAPMEGDAGAMMTLGRSLFVDHLWSTILAGVLLLIATYGAIVIALHTRETSK